MATQNSINTHTHTMHSMHDTTQVLDSVPDSMPDSVLNSAIDSALDSVHGIMQDSVLD